MKYLNFNGTATRSEYWGVFFLGAAAVLLVAFICGLVGAYSGNSSVDTVAGFVAGLSGIAYTVVYITTTIRRLRDAGVNPWFTLLVGAPYVSFIAVILFGCLPTEQTKGE